MAKQAACVPPPMLVGLLVAGGAGGLARPSSSRIGGSAEGWRLCPVPARFHGSLLGIHAAVRLEVAEGAWAWAVVRAAPRAPPRHALLPPRGRRPPRAAEHRACVTLDGLGLRGVTGVAHVGDAGVRLARRLRATWPTAGSAWPGSPTTTHGPRCGSRSTPTCSGGLSCGCGASTAATAPPRRVDSTPVRAEGRLTVMSLGAGLACCRRVEPPCCCALPVQGGACPSPPSPGPSGAVVPPRRRPHSHTHTDTHSTTRGHLHQAREPSDERWLASTCCHGDGSQFDFVVSDGHLTIQRIRCTGKRPRVSRRRVPCFFFLPRPIHASTDRCPVPQQTSRSKRSRNGAPATAAPVAHRRRRHGSPPAAGRLPWGAGGAMGYEDLIRPLQAITSFVPQQHPELSVVRTVIEELVRGPPSGADVQVIERLLQAKLGEGRTRAVVAPASCATFLR